jgi:hypothetical protein
MADSVVPLSRFAVLVKKLGREERCRAVLADPGALREAFARAEAKSVVTVATAPATGDVDRAALAELEQDLAGAFLLSPEAAALDSMSSYEQLFELARASFGRTALSLEAAQLAMLVFEVLPRKVMLEAEDAAPVVADLRLFYAFLERVFALPQARACLEVLGEGAAEKLAEAIASGEHFTRERAILLEGTKAGFDMYTPEGIQAYVAFKKAQAGLN